MMTMPTTKLSAALAAAAIVLFASVSHATILTFGITGINNGTSLEDHHPEYGDNVASITQMNGSHTYSYLEGNGFTPNVVVDYDGGTSSAPWWGTGFQGIAPVAYNGGPGRMLQIDLVADPGYEVVLHSFDLAAFGNSNQMSGDIIASDGTNTFTDSSNPVISLLTYDSDDFGMLQGSTITVSYDDSEDGQIGIDNIHFTQVLATPAVVPEPTAVVMWCLLGIVGVGFAAWRRKRLKCV